MSKNKKHPLISDRSLVKLYKGLLLEDKITVGGSAYERMQSLKHRITMERRRKLAIPRPRKKKDISKGKYPKALKKQGVNNSS